MDSEKHWEMLTNFQHGDLNASTKDLEDWLNLVNTSDERMQRYARKVEFELQRRQIAENIKWQKWMTVVTGIMAIATVILAVITYIKH